MRIQLTVTLNVDQEAWADMYSQDDNRTASAVSRDVAVHNCLADSAAAEDKLITAVQVTR